MKSLLLLFLIFSAFARLHTPGKDISVRNMNFNEDWEFKFASSSTWKKLDLPHDFSIIQAFDEYNEGESGFLPGGSGNYRKTFTLQQPEEDARVMILFYGSYKDTYVYINGFKIGENHYGYNSFAFDITDHIKFGQSNTINVNVTNEIPSSRWYSGSGIFRDVELIITGLVHLDLDGLKITTPDIESGKGTVAVEAEIKNDKTTSASAKLAIKIVDKAGTTVASYTGTTAESITTKTVKTLKASLTVPTPHLWSDTDPYLYTLKLEIQNEKGEAIDHFDQRFGFRYFKFDMLGFHLNNKGVKLNGVSQHHDHGALGSVDNYDAVVRKFKQLKDMGMNAVRTTHNIASKHWINLADEMGIIIVEEFFDGWYYSKNGNMYDFSEYFAVTLKEDNQIYGREDNQTWYQFCTKSVIRRDRNNPSVVMWSLGNELSAGSMIDEYYPVYLQKMIDIGHKYDTTRPFTTGDNNSYKDFPDYYHTQIAQKIHDNKGVEGFNYATGEQLKVQATKWGSCYISESASAINSRGIYNVFSNGYDGYHDGKYHLTSYETSYVPWGYT